MNRRSVLKFLAAIPAALFLPAVAQAKQTVPVSATEVLNREIEPDAVYGMGPAEKVLTDFHTQLMTLELEGAMPGWDIDVSVNDSRRLFRMYAWNPVHNCDVGDTLTSAEMFSRLKKDELVRKFGLHAKHIANRR